MSLAAWAQAIDLALVLELLALGALSGFLAGLLGIGGGMVMVPVLTWLFDQRGFPASHLVQMAVATALTTILFTSASSVRAHYKIGAVRLDLLPAMGVGAFLGTALGAQLAGGLKSSWLAGIFAGVVGYVALNMLRPKPAVQPRPMPHRLVLGLVGWGIGLVSSMVGAGGGFLTVPFLTHRGIALHQAVATSSGMGFPIALGGLLGYVWAGQGLTGLPSGSLGLIYLPALGLLVTASIFTAPLGARSAHALPVQTLKRAFAWMLLALASYMLTRLF